MADTGNAARAGVICKPDVVMSTKIDVQRNDVCPDRHCVGRKQADSSPCRNAEIVRAADVGTHRYGGNAVADLLLIGFERNQLFRRLYDKGVPLEIVQRFRTSMALDVGFGGEEHKM